MQSFVSSMNDQTTTRHQRLNNNYSRYLCHRTTILPSRTPISSIRHSKIPSGGRSRNDACEPPNLYHLQDTLNLLPDLTDPLTMQSFVSSTNDQSTTRHQRLNNNYSRYPCHRTTILPSWTPISSIRHSKIPSGGSSRNDACEHQHATGGDRASCIGHGG